MKSSTGPSLFVSRVAVLALALVATGLTGCSDDDEHAEEEHLDATGSALIFNGDTLVKAMSGDTADVSGLVTLTLGDTLGPCLVLFLSDEGAWFIPEEEEGGEHADGLEIRSTGGFSGFGSAETWQVWLVPSTVGTGSFRLAVLHEGHDDYVSPLMPVQVVAAP